MNNSLQHTLSIGCEEKYVGELVSLKFLGLQIGNHLNWQNHIDGLVPKLSVACYEVRAMSHISNTDILKSVHFACLRSVMKYGMIYWNNSCNSRKIFTLQKKSLKLWPVSDQEIHIDVCLNSYMEYFQISNSHTVGY
jgi:hypothetical protein